MSDRRNLNQIIVRAKKRHNIVHVYHHESSDNCHRGRIRLDADFPYGRYSYRENRKVG